MGLKGGKASDFKPPFLRDVKSAFGETRHRFLTSLNKKALLLN
jgi:hypothetical protein